MSDSHDVLESPSCGTGAAFEDVTDTNRVSELIDVTYTACSTNTGEVLASTITRYLQTLTVQSPDQDRLDSLQRLLDPDLQDPHVSRETFHSVMREWVTQCSQDSSDANDCHVSWPSSSEISINGLALSFSETRADFPEIQSSWAGQDVSDTVAELKNAHHKLSEQNRSLLVILEQSEDVNLQLSLEITELQAKLASAQRSAIRTRSLTEDLEETRQLLKEAQERAGHTQRRFTKLTSEIDDLKGHVRRLEDKNRKLAFERSLMDESLNNLRRVNSELRAERERALLTLMLRNREVTKVKFFL
ncbi:inositol 1,4,5-triphosphate receptor associated 2 [Nothobranchius furzeri]|uniref:inositol 1,4,5-triphosphate receptor associated 2 n=1 Tax=Nothobranchius furzeri TaxID=105023 RepID=UPI003904C093